MDEGIPVFIKSFHSDLQATDEGARRMKHHGVHLFMHCANIVFGKDVVGVCSVLCQMLWRVMVQL